MVEKLGADLHAKSVIRFTWWGNAMVGVESVDRSIVIDPWISPEGGNFQYVFCTHEHHAHADPEAVENLSRNPNFRRMFIARSTLYPSNNPSARCLSFLSEPQWLIDRYVIVYPKHYDHSIPRGAEGDTALLAGTGRLAPSDEIAAGDYAAENGTPRPFGGVDELWVDGWHVECMEMLGGDAEVPYLVRGAMPQLGFFIEDLVSGVSLYHMGATRRTYPEMAAIRGRVDILFLPIGKMSLEDEAEALRLTNPKCIIPIGWRDDADHRPIPRSGPGGGETDKFDSESPSDPKKHIDQLTDLAKTKGIQVVTLKAGVAYQV